MFIKKLLPVLFVFVISAVSAQQNFQYTPQNPKAGDVINISYTPAGDIANTQLPVEGVVYTLGSKGQNAEDILLKKEGSKYTVSFKTDTSQNFVYLGFSADKKFDNNFNDGYWIQLYDGDKIKMGSNMSLAMFYQFYGGGAGVEASNPKALQYMEKEFALYPESKQKNLTSYLRTNISVNKDQAPALLQKEIEGALKRGLKEEADYALLENLYNLSKLPEQGKLITSLKKEKYPNGKWAIGENIMKYNKEQDIAKKELLLNEISQKIATDENWKYLQTSLPLYQTSILNAYISKKDWLGFKNAIDKTTIKDKNQLTGLYNTAAWEMQKTSDNLKLAEEFSAKSVAIAKSEWQNPSGSKPPPYTKKQWDKERERTYGMYADTYAMVLFRMGQYKKGMPYAKDAALKIDKGESAAANNTYALLAEKAMPAKQYKKELEQFVKAGKATGEIKDILKRTYSKEHKSETGFDEYISALEKESYLLMVAELRKSMLNEASPSFALYDLDKNKIDIADLKNKVVVVDFWATWCGPCKASFPSMQKMVTKFKDNADIKFVFVDTWERGEDKQKDASDFIAANKYTFHVLQDVDNKVVEQFKVDGIPTKFIIDKNGMIRFKSVGYDGDEKLMKELTAMIEMAQDLKKSF